MNDDLIYNSAVAYAKVNKSAIANRITDLGKFPSEDDPVSVFMAGSPGAGKTEVSKRLLARFEEPDEANKSIATVIRIDADELRSEFEDYSGTNSHLFQHAVSILVHSIHDFALKRSQSFVLDGTFANFEISKQNIERSLKRQQFVQIYYVYQSPLQAWKFVSERELIEGRRILPERFVDQYFRARENVNKLKEYFGNRIRLTVLHKSIDRKNRSVYTSVDCIDHHIPEQFASEAIEEIIQINSH